MIITSINIFASLCVINNITYQCGCYTAAFCMYNFLQLTDKNSFLFYDIMDDNLLFELGELEVSAIAIAISIAIACVDAII